MERESASFRLGTRETILPDVSAFMHHLGPTLDFRHCATPSGTASL